MARQLLNSKRTKDKNLFQLDYKVPRIFDQINEKPTHDALNVTIRRFYTNDAGTIIDKTAVPAILQQKFPVYLFGAFDKNGGYRIANQIAPAQIGGFLYARTINSQYDFTQFSGLNNVRDYFQQGDFVLLYADDLNSPTYFVWILISCDFQSYGAVLENTYAKTLDVKEVLYSSDNLDNFNETMYYVVNNSIGIYKQYTIQPLGGKTPTQGLNDFLKLPYNFQFNQYSSLLTYISFATDLINLQFIVKNIKNLT